MMHTHVCAAALGAGARGVTAGSRWTGHWIIGTSVRRMPRTSTDGVARTASACYGSGMKVRTIHGQYDSVIASSYKVRWRYSLW